MDPEPKPGPEGVSPERPGTSQPARRGRRGGRGRRGRGRRPPEPSAQQPPAPPEEAAEPTPPGAEPLPVEQETPRHPSGSRGPSTDGCPGTRPAPPRSGSGNRRHRRRCARRSKRSTTSSRRSAAPWTTWRKCWRPSNWPSGRRTRTSRRSKPCAAACGNCTGHREGGQHPPRH